MLPCAGVDSTYTKPCCCCCQHEHEHRRYHHHRYRHHRGWILAAAKAVAFPEAPERPKGTPPVSIPETNSRELASPPRSTPRTVPAHILPTFPPSAIRTRAPDRQDGADHPRGPHTTLQHHCLLVSQYKQSIYIMYIYIINYKYYKVTAIHYSEEMSGEIDLFHSEKEIQ